MIKKSHQLKKLYRQVFSSLSFQDQLRAVYRKITADIQSNWTIYFKDEFEEIGRPITQDQAEKVKTYTFSKVKSFFPIFNEATEQMQVLIMNLIEKDWWGKLKNQHNFEDMDAQDIIRILIRKKVPQLLMNQYQHSKRDIRDKSKEIYNIHKTKEQQEGPLSISEELDARLENEESIMLRWEQEQDNQEWQIIMNDFAKSLEGKEKGAYSKIDLFKKYFFEGYTFKEIADEISEGQEKKIYPASIRHQILNLGDDFRKFLHSYKNQTILEDILEDMR